MRRILLVEDEAINRLYLKHILQRENYSISEASDGIEAVSAVRNDCPDCVLMDIGLPRMNGIDAIYEIRKSPEYRDLPILAVTAHAHKEDRERITAAGASGIILKPYKQEELITALNSLFSSD